MVQRLVLAFSFSLSVRAWRKAAALHRHARRSCRTAFVGGRCGLTVSFANASVCGRSRLLHPLGGLGIPDEIEKPSQEGDAVTAPKTEFRGMRRECLGERTGIVV